MAAHLGQRVVLQRALHRRLHAPRRADADGVGDAAVVDADVLHQPHHALHLVGADLALVGAAQRAGDRAAHLDAGGVRGRHHRRGSARCSRRCEQLMLRWLKASLAAPKTTTSSGQRARRRQRRLQALHVGRQHRVAHAGRALRCRPSPRRCRPSAAPTSGSTKLVTSISRSRRPAAGARARSCAPRRPAAPRSAGRRAGRPRRG